MSTSAKAGKGGTMSSRLLTMKFMQRAAASPANSSPPPPTEEEPSRKRRKTDSNIPSVTSTSNHEIAQAALAAEEAKKQQVLDRLAQEAGDTKWSFEYSITDSLNDNNSLRVVNAGYSSIDAAISNLEDTGDNQGGAMKRPQVQGRISFGDFGKAVKKNKETDQDDESDEDGDENSNSDEDGSEDGHSKNDRVSTGELRSTPAGDRAREERIARRKRKSAEGAEMAEKRRSKGVQLNQLSSISSGGGSRTTNMECFKCGGKGHAQRDCPKAGKGRKSY